MGLIFQKYVKNAYCQKCKQRFELKVKFEATDCHCGLPIKGQLGFDRSMSFEYFYLSTIGNIRIPENSIWSKIFVIWPSIVLGVIGLLPFALFLMFAIYDGFASAWAAIVNSFWRIYGDSSYIHPEILESSLLFRILGNDWFVYCILVISLYFAFRFSLIIFYAFFYAFKRKAGEEDYL